MGRHIHDIFVILGPLPPALPSAMCLNQQHASYLPIERPALYFNHFVTLLLGLGTYLLNFKNNPYGLFSLLTLILDLLYAFTFGTTIHKYITSYFFVFKLIESLFCIMLN